MAILRAHRYPNAMTDPIARAGRSIMLLLHAWRTRAPNHRELAALSERLLVDIGLDARDVREQARIADLGRPSRANAPCEVVQGVSHPYAMGGSELNGDHLEC